ncbi:ABC transporter permease [Nocardioides sp.]|uniref:ABC transporter permease n=1 Tax=Nocardioides sp. TaxID=35761 RepID=UPI0027354162|nr:ABC transporter permease [Nocardioides sp.]MDP3893897.1 ABC transporter permease [Nocardioides sp.]
MADTVAAAEEPEGPRSVRVVDAPLVEPSNNSGLLEVFRRRYLLRLLVRREISARYQGSFLGMIWSYINPLSQLFLFYVVIGIIIGLRSTENFGIHVFAGLIVVVFFTETFNAGTRSIVRNKALVSKLAVPREMFPVASMMVSGFHMGPQLVIMAIACAVLGWTPDPVGMAALVLALLMMMVLGTALALMFSAANVFFRDIANAINVLTNFVRFGVPMIYPFTMVETRFGEGSVDAYLMNPIAQAVLLMQRAFWVGTTEDVEGTIATHLPDDLFTRGLISLAGCLVLLVVAQWVFTRFENRIPEHLS